MFSKLDHRAVGDAGRIADDEGRVGHDRVRGGGVGFRRVLAGHEEERDNGAENPEMARKTLERHGHSGTGTIGKD